MLKRVRVRVETLQSGGSDPSRLSDDLLLASILAEGDRLFAGPTDLDDLTDLLASLDSDPEQKPPEPEHTDLITEGKLKSDGTLYRLSYDDFAAALDEEDGEVSPKTATQTVLSFAASDPSFITLCRSGGIGTTLTFEQGERTTSICRTPIFSFDITIHTLRVANTLLSRDGALHDGGILIEYKTESRGTEVGHFLMRVTVSGIDSPIKGTRK